MYTHFVEEHNLHAPICYSSNELPSPSIAIHFDATTFAFVLVKCKSQWDWWSKKTIGFSNAIEAANRFQFNLHSSSSNVDYNILNVKPLMRQWRIQLRLLQCDGSTPKIFSMSGLESVRFILMNEYRSIRSIFRGVKLIKYMNRRENSIFVSTVALSGLTLSAK